MRNATSSWERVVLSMMPHAMREPSLACTMKGLPSMGSDWVGVDGQYGAGVA